jgi:hypothetical protein
MTLIAAIFGVSCLVSLLPLVLVSFWCLWRLGRAIEAVAPDVWAEMRPEFGIPHKVLNQCGQRRALFLASREYESLGSPIVNQRARTYQRLQKAIVVALIGAILTVIWAVS